MLPYLEEKNVTSVIRTYVHFAMTASSKYYYENKIPKKLGRFYNKRMICQSKRK